MYEEKKENIGTKYENECSKFKVCDNSIVELLIIFLVSFNVFITERKGFI